MPSHELCSSSNLHQAPHVLACKPRISLGGLAKAMHAVDMHANAHAPFFLPRVHHSNAHASIANTPAPCTSGHTALFALSHRLTVHIHTSPCHMCTVACGCECPLLLGAVCLPDAMRSCWQRRSRSVQQMSRKSSGHSTVM